MRAELLNGGAYNRAAFGAINKTAIAAGAGDNTLVTGAFQPRLLSKKGLAMSVKVVIIWTATLAAAQTLKFAAKLQAASDAAGTGAADYGTALASTTVATSVGGGTVTGTTELDFDLSGANSHIAALVTPDLSAGVTDTCEWSMAYVFYGHQADPVSASLV